MLVGEETFRLVEPMFEWGPATELELKGKSGPVVARVGAGRDRDPRAHAGPRGRPGAADRPRARARRRTSRSVDGVLAGTGGILFVTGEPGIGKTRLLAELHDLFDAGVAAARPRAVARGPVRVLRRVDAVLAVPRPPAFVARRPRGRAGAAGARRAPPDGRAAVRRSRGRALPVPRRAAGADARARRRERLAELSPEALQYRTFEVDPRAARAARAGRARLRSCSRTCTGPTRRRCSCSSGCSPTRRPRRSCSS